MYETNEDGLPVVGTTVVYNQTDGLKLAAAVKPWKYGDYLEVIAHAVVRDNPIAVLFNLREESVSCLIKSCYEPMPVKSPPPLPISDEWRWQANRGMQPVSDTARVDWRGHGDHGGDAVEAGGLDWSIDPVGSYPIRKWRLTEDRSVPEPDLNKDMDVPDGLLMKGNVNRLIDYAVMERNRSASEFGENDYWDAFLKDLLESLGFKVTHENEEFKVTNKDMDVPAELTKVQLSSIYGKFPHAKLLDVEHRYRLGTEPVDNGMYGDNVVQNIKVLQTRKLTADDVGVQSWSEWEDVPVEV